MQSGKIVHPDLVKHLKKYGYVQAENINGISVHQLCDIVHTSSDNFRIN